MIISLGLGIPLGFFTAFKQGTWLDTATVSITLLFMSMPVFLTAPGLLIIFSLWMGLLPTHGWGGFFDTQIIMPALVLGIPGVAGLTRLTRASTLEVLSQEYVRTARAKGLHEHTVRYRHILRNSLIPIFTVVGLSLATLISGAFITEGFFGIPGIGRLAIESFFARDYPIIMALTLIISVAFVFANLLVDISYRVIDPRIRY
jgi:peptide/nickel transport system permease protein